MKYDSSCKMYFVEVGGLMIYGSTPADVMINCSHAQVIYKLVKPID